MTRTNNAAKNAAREHQRKAGGNYTTALRHVKRVTSHDGDWNLMVPFAAVDGWFKQIHSDMHRQCISIDSPAGGVVLSDGEAREGGLSISLLAALADRYSPQRVNFMTWGFDDDRLRKAGLADYLVDSSHGSLTEFLAAASAEDRARSKKFDESGVGTLADYREKGGIHGPAMANLVIVVKVHLDDETRPTGNDGNALERLKNSNFSGLTVVVDLIADGKSASGALSAAKFRLGIDHSHGWVLQAKFDGAKNRWSPRPGEGRNRDQFLAHADSELNRLIGLDEPKKQVQLLRQQVLLEFEYRKRGMPLAKRPRHLLLEGPVGSGKSTMAQVVADLYTGLGVLRTGQFETLSCEPSKLGFLTDRPRGGVLFMDTSRWASRSVIDAIDAIVSREVDDVMFIVAGDSAVLEMAIDAVDGASRDFSTTITFQPYQPSEIAELATEVAGETGQTLTAEAGRAIEDHLGMVYRGNPNLAAKALTGNARLARAIVEGAETHRGLRLPTDFTDLTDDELRTLTEVDVTLALRKIFRDSRN
ncbi:hypothetical protein [Rhodococcus sp. H-CA8f]|uniref:hypothetical protein n=1 Tax=Rhodococcus sp. H-CA8f TaxID=1727214 RepID=UPI0012FF87FA|nr:hypothetical protein [Rhodococcus sp. H-CA8f]